MSTIQDLEQSREERLSLRRKRTVLETRAKIMAETRRFFEERGFLAVETPVRIPVAALEDYIEAESSGDCWLRTSPEFHMKRLLAAGYERIYQLGPCFRPGEKGRRHNPEFTMLEWYRCNSDWRQLRQDMTELVQALAEQCLGRQQVDFRGHRLDLNDPWPEMTVEEAFRKFANAQVDECCADGSFEQVLVEQVEPNLGLDKPLFLTEYPLACSGLSRAFPDRPNRVERWELYVSGLELANACTELTDAVEQERRFEVSTELRRREGRPLYGIDMPFLSAMKLGMPVCAGTAVGMDRLVMLLTNAEEISQVLAFPG